MSLSLRGAKFVCAVRIENAAFLLTCTVLNRGGCERNSSGLKISQQENEF